MGVEVVRAPLGDVLWYLGYYRNETENSEAKPCQVTINYVKDAVVDSWIMSGNSEEGE